MPARQGEIRLRGVQPLPPRQAQKPLLGLQPLPSRQAERLLRSVLDGTRGSAECEADQARAVDHPRLFRHRRVERTDEEGQG